MAIKIKFDLAGNPEPPTIILANRNGNKLGQLKVNTDSIELVDKLNDASEISFTINKYANGKFTPLWDKIVDFKLIYCKEWDAWFEIKVELDEETETVKTVFCTHLSEAELSQIMLYNIEINTEKDIERDDYKISILCDSNNQEASILHRILKDKASHYSIAYVSPTIASIQRSFSFDNTSILDAFQKISKEIGCLFQYENSIDENGRLQRKIYVYDLQQYCNDCGHRSAYTSKCPKCDSTNITNGYGNDTLIFVTSDELASNGIQLVTDTDSVKNCFNLEAGDDLMTATVRNCNPNGSNYIWYFSDAVKEDMSDELVQKIESYDELYKHQYNSSVSNIDAQIIENYNKLVEKYSVYNQDLEEVETSIIGYPNLMNAYYNVIDMLLLLESSLMPSVEISETNAAEQASLLGVGSLSPVAVTDIGIVSLATANSAVLAMAKTVVKPTFKIEIKSSELTTSGATKYWKGNFIITNYSDEDDAAESSQISIVLNDDLETVTKQKIKKLLTRDNTNNLSITGLFELEHNHFCEELKKYALNPLIRFHDACQSCIDILIDQGVADKNTWSDNQSGSDGNLYEKLYIPYYNKLQAIEAEMKVRESEINIISGTHDIDGNLVTDGLQKMIEDCRDKIQTSLDFKNHLGEKLWLDFCAYRREDTYSNDNYISDGLNNVELFKKAQEFIEVAENEIYKSAELQHSISTTLNNLLAIKKFKPLIDSFENGNWIRVQVNDELYKLRLIEYTIDFGSFEKIPVEFSDVVKIRNGISDIESILSQASSMATSYDSVKRQSAQGNNAQTTINQWVTSGLNSALVQIQNNNSEDIIFNKNGLLCRSYDDIADTYAPEQFRLTHNIMAYTSDNWKTVSAALGNHEYNYFDSSKILRKDVGYGLTAKFVTAGYINGSQIIGGEIYSSNYSSGGLGSYLNLVNGTFSFAGGRLTYNSNTLSVNGEITATSGTIGGCTIANGVLKIGNININERLTADVIDSTNIEVSAANVVGKLVAEQIDATNLEVFAANVSGRLTAEQIDATDLKVAAANVTGTLTATQIDAANLKVAAANVTGQLTASQIDATNLKVSAANITGTLTAEQVNAKNLKVSAANIEGQLTASQINTSGLIAENISGTTISGKTISGGSINIGSGNFKVDSSGNLTANKGTFKGTLDGVSGSFTTLSAGDSYFCSTYVTINAEGKGGIHIGAPVKGEWVDITVRPDINGVGNIGDPNYQWDRIVVHGWWNQSKRDAKENIDMYDTEIAYEELKNLPIYRYFYKSESPSTKSMTIGTMIDYIPSEAMCITSNGSECYNVSSMMFWNIAASQVMQRKLEDLIIKVNELEDKIG